MVAFIHLCPTHSPRILSRYSYMFKMHSKCNQAHNALTNESATNNNANNNSCYSNNSSAFDFHSIGDSCRDR